MAGDAQGSSPRRHRAGGSVEWRRALAVAGSGGGFRLDGPEYPGSEHGFQETLLGNGSGKGPSLSGEGRFMKLLVSLLLLTGIAMGAKKKTPATATPLDRYVSEAEARSAVAASLTPGSIWLPGSRLADAARDVRASQVDDL